MQPGDVFSTEKLRNGLKNLTKVYSQFGYIDYVAEPQIDIVPNTNKIDLTLNADEGKQFFVRRIDFTGNTTTRDKVIRREILIDEGDVYNSTLWDASILRLNQLGYFEALKENESYELKRNAGTNTVDITLKVKERGKNSISLNGGVSGISGTFIGLNYSTNNFLGLGETLTHAVAGRNAAGPHHARLHATVSFRSPAAGGHHGLSQPLQLRSGAGRNRCSPAVNLQAFYNSLGSANVLNYVQDSKGITLSASYPIKRSFARLGVTLGYDISSIKTESTGRHGVFHVPQLPGRERAQRAERHQDIQHHAVVQLQLEEQLLRTPPPARASSSRSKPAASVLGANVNIIQPTFDGQYYHASPRWHKNVLAFHLLATTVTGYGGKVAPPFMRGYHRRREGRARIRFLQHRSDRVHSEQRDRQPAESRRQPARSERDRRRHQDTGEHYTAHPDVPDHHAGRRYARRIQFRVPDSDRRTHHPGAVLRCGREPDSVYQSAAR